VSSIAQTSGAPLRIAFLSVSSEMGGSEVSLVSLVRGLRRRVPDWALDVVVPREGPLSSAVEMAGARAHVMPLPESLSRLGEASPGGAPGMLRRAGSLMLSAGGVARYGRELARLLSRTKPDVVHSNGFKMHVLGARSAPDGAALIWHVHEYVARRPLSRRLLRRFAARCDGIVTNSHSVAAEIHEALPVPVPVTTIYNAVDATEFAPDGDRVDLDRLAGLPPAPPETIRVGLVATYGRWKGHATFIEAMRRLPSALPVRGYIVGGALYDTTGSQYSRGELEALIASAGLEGRVGLTGFVERPAAAFRALDVVVHASTQPEPFGLVIAEGLATGRAVLVSAAGGAAELVVDGVDALTHPPGDVDALAGGIARLAGDAQLRTRLGARGRETAVRLFAPETFITEFIDVYRAARARSSLHAGR
jgi:glycosyltransferase involved in cell wall biosynthesis